MPHMRPGTIIKFWSPRFENRPDVEPPALLKLVGALSIFSVVGVLVYAVARQLAVGGSAGVVGVEAMYVALLHFVMPFGVFYAINMNSPYTVSYTHLTLPTTCRVCRSRWSAGHL